MEKNKINGDILPVVAYQDIPEGRMVFLTTHSYDNDFGSLVDLPGIDLPNTADEAKRARFVAGLAEDNRPTPIYAPMPSYPWAMRQTWDQTANVPFATTVYLTQPGHTKNPTIPSGYGCLAFGAGTYTVPSGAYIYSAGLATVGALLSVSYAGGSEGKLQVQATWDTDLVVAVTEAFDTATGDLTFKTHLF